MRLQSDVIAMKDRRIIIPGTLQDKALKQLHWSHMGIEKTRLLAYESIYWININADIEETVNIVPLALIFKQQKQKIRQSVGLTSLPLITSIIFVL